MHFQQKTSLLDTAISMARRHLVFLNRSLFVRTHGQSSSKFALAATSFTAGVRPYPLPYPRDRAFDRIRSPLSLVFPVMVLQFWQAAQDFLEMDLGRLLSVDEHDDGPYRRVPPILCFLAKLIISGRRTRYDGSPVFDCSDSHVCVKT